SRSMQIVRAGAESHVDHRRSATEGRWRGVGLHLEFLDGIHGWIENENIRIGVNTLNAVEQVNPHVRRVAVDGRSTGPASRGVAAVGDVCRAALIGYAGRELYQLRKIAVVER